MSFFENAKAITFAGKAVKKLELAGKVIWEAISFKNWVPYSTTNDGKTIYNGTGYKEGYRIRSGGAEGATANAVCTGFIPFKSGDILRIFPPFSGQNSINTLNFADISFTNLGQYNDNGSMYGICSAVAGWKNIATEIGSITRVDISGVSNGGDVAYVRLSHVYNSGNIADEFEVQSGAELIVAINQEIPQ